MKTVSSSIALLAATIVIALAGTGCRTFKEVQPLTVGHPPAARPSALVLGQVQVTDSRLSQAQQQLMTEAFNLGVKKYYAEHPGLEVLGHASATNLPPGALTLEGTVGEVEKGSAAARFWVGMGAGQQRTQGEFAVISAEGTKLLTFLARKSYLGGQGIGGWDMMKLDELVDELGQLVAETTDKWLRGQKIN